MIDYYKNIPEDLKKEKRWCLYKIVNKNGKNTKIPIEPSGKYAKVSDKTTWNTYERCLNSLDKADGLGFFLGDGYVGIDLDDVADDVYAYFTDNKESVTSDFLKNIDTYAEVSPSGRGIHFIGKGKLEGTRRRSGNIEIYDKDRFFTVTGKILNDKYRKKIANIETEINKLKLKYLPEFEKSEIDKSEVGDYEDREVLELFLNSDIGDTSEVKKEIFDGKWEKKFSSQSEADFYLARNLLFFNGGNIEQAYRLMYKSKLSREKWSEQRGSTDYLEYILLRARDGLTSYFQRSEKEEITTVDRKYTIEDVKQLINETINSFSNVENFNNYLKVSASNSNTFYTDRLMLLKFRKDSEETKTFDDWIDSGRIVNKGEEGIPILRNGQVKYIYDKSQTVVVNAELEQETETSKKTIVEQLENFNIFENTESIEKTIENLGISYARRVYSRVRDNAPETFESLDENVLGDFIKNTFTTIVKLKSGINAPDIQDEKGVLKVFLKNENDIKELLYSFWGCENALFNNLEKRIKEIQRKMTNDIDIDSTNGYNINRDIINKEGSEENVLQSEIRNEEQRILNRRNDLLSGGKDERDGRDRLLDGRDGAGKSGISNASSSDRQERDETSTDRDNRGADDERHQLDDIRSVQSGSRVGNDENQRDGGNERQIRGTDPRSGSRDRTDRREDELLSGRERGIQETLQDLRQIDGQESGVGSEIRERDVRSGQQISEERMVGSRRERELGRNSLQPEKQPLEQSDLGGSRGHDEPISDVKSGMDKGQSPDVLQTSILDRPIENIPGQLPKEDRGLQENRETENDRGVGEEIRKATTERDDEQSGERSQGDDLLQRDPVTIDDKKEADEASFLIAVKVGNEFILENKSVFNNIDLTEDNEVVEVDGKKYNLFKGIDFKDSQKIDELLDSENYEIYKVADYEKQTDSEQRETIESLPDDKEESNKSGYEPDKESPSFARDYDLLNHIYSKFLTPSVKLDQNIKAIKMLKRLEAENRNPREYEQAYLADYLGWGGLSDVFDERKDGQWKEARDYLKKNLTSEEYERARESTLTAFYTPNNVIRAIYKKLEDMGFSGGKVLDPSTGTGRFIGNLPKDLKDKTNFTAIELDSITGKIAKYLYPNQNVNISGYEDFSVSDNSFDVAITNVPFGNFKVFDNEYNKYNLFIHDYFFKKSIDKVRDGGIIVFITSSGTMDKKSNDIRKMIEVKADFLGAVRLPNNLFKNEAGTSVMSDIIFLQKNENKEVENEKSEWLTAVPNGYGAIVNNYFLSNPEQVVGTLSTVNGRFGKELITTLDDESDFDELLDKALSNINGKITERKDIEKTESEIESILAPENEKKYSYFLKDDEIYFKEDLYAYKVSLNRSDTSRIEKYIPLRNTLLKLVEKQNEDIPDDDQELIYLRSELMERYNDFNDKLGRINESKNFRILSEDGYSGLVSSLEIMDDDNDFKELSSIFEKRNIRPERKITQVDNSKDALILSMQFKGKVDFVYMEQLSNKTKPELINDLSDEIFLDFNTVDFSKDNIYEEAKYNSDPNRYIFETRAEFLSGDIRKKLARINAYKNKLTILMDNNSDDVDKEKLNAEMNIAKYQANLLENVMPKDLSAGDINVRLGSTWIETYDYEDFMKEAFLAPYGATVEYSPSNSKFRLDRGTLNTYSDIVNVTFGTSRMDAYKIMENTMNMKSVEVKDVFTEDGKKYEVLNQPETDKALMMQAKIEEVFKEWIFKDSNRRQRLVAKYNELFNSYRQREYDGENLVLSGINPDIKLREHQKSAIERDLYSTTSTLLAHAVGAGKTFEMACIAMESKRLGLSNKSLIVVPKNIVQQFAREFYSIYPTANLLVASEKDFNPQKRRQFIGRIATGDYDAIIIANSQFQKIPVSWERQKLTMERELLAYKALEDSGYKRDFSVKQAENARKRLEKRYKEFLNTPKDDMLCFEELGVDKLIIDEAHNYKNLAFQTTLSNVAGINTNGSQRSLDMLMKCEYIRELNNGKGVVFATGTPVSNSMAELYTMSRYLDPQGLEDKGILNFDAWASNFADITVGYELEATGTKFRKRTRFSKFNNLPELMNIVKSFADIRTSDMLNLPVPEVEFKLETIEPSEIQKDYIKNLGDRADKIKSGSVDPSVDNMLVVTNDGKNLALDQRLVDPLLPDDPNSKVNACVRNVFRIYKDTEDKKLTQLIFCDTATPGGSSNICVYDDIKEKLIKMGAKESEIAFVHDAKNDNAKAELFSKVNKGEIRVLIGSTSKMGTGTNVQKKLIATHDLDVPWRPSDLEQRAGRIIRQGNENKKVEIYRYVTKGTLDSFLWQTLENKQRYISQVMTSRTPERSMEDCDEVTLDYATIKGIANGNPLIEEKFRLETEVAKLKTYETAYRNNLYQYEDNLKIQYPKKEAIIKKKISDLTADIERRIDCNNEDKKFIGMQFENSFTDKKDIASEVLMKNISKIEHSIKADPVKLCDYRGFEIYGKYEPLVGGDFKSCHQFIVKGSGSYIGELSDSGYGNIVRIDNVINNLTSKLEEAKSALIDLNNQKNNALEEINKPFTYKKELEEKVNRLNEVNKEIEIKTEGEPGEPQQDSEKDEKNKSLVNDMETLREKAKEYNLERVSPGKKEKANEL